MSIINLLNVIVLDNPCAFTNPFQLEITFECLRDLPDGIFLIILIDLEWKLTYVGSAESERDDQVLESVLVGPVIQGCHRFVLQVFYYIFNRPIHLILH